MAERAKAQGFHQVLWLDQSHHDVEEAGTMNVFFRIDDTVVIAAGKPQILTASPRDIKSNTLG